MDIDQFLDHVKDQANVTSDRRLSELCKMGTSTVNGYRKRGLLPSDETMLKLAKLAEFDPDDALLLLNIWRTTGKAKARYSAMLARRTATAIGLLILATPLIYTDSFAQVSDVSQNNHYYEKFNQILKRKIKTMLTRLNPWTSLFPKLAQNMKPISLEKFYQKPLPI